MKKSTPKSRKAAAMRHADRPGAGAKKRKSLPKKEKVGVVMSEFKRGTLRSGGSGKKVTNRKQAMAIALSEAGKSKRKSPANSAKKWAKGVMAKRRAASAYWKRDSLA